MNDLGGVMVFGLAARRLKELRAIGEDTAISCPPGHSEIVRETFMETPNLTGHEKQKIKNILELSRLLLPLC